MKWCVEEYTFLIYIRASLKKEVDYSVAVFHACCNHQGRPAAIILDGFQSGTHISLRTVSWALKVSCE